MNILIITPFFKHDRNIASVRWTNLATRLCKRHNVIVVTQPHDDMDMTESIARDEDGILVARLNQKTAYEKFAVKHFGGATGDDWQTRSPNQDEDVPAKESAVRKLKNRVLLTSMELKARQYARKIKHQVLSRDTKIDVIISSACPFIEMLIGYELKKRLGCKWISDFRDLPFYNKKTDLFQKMCRIMQRVLPLAEKIIVVIPTMVSAINQLVGVPTEQVTVISNGYSKHDFVDNTLSYEDGILHLGFTGTLGSNGSETDQLFEVLKMCQEEREDFSFSIDCAGGNAYLIEQAAKRYGLENFVHNKGFIPREQALALQRKSDCLLVFVNVDHGGFAAKILEYLLCRKPIINIVYGPKGGCYSKKFIEELKVGIAIEQATPEDKTLLKEYLLMQFDRKRQGLPMFYEPITEKVVQYDHDYLAEQVEKLVQSVL